MSRLRWTAALAAALMLVAVPALAKKEAGGPKYDKKDVDVIPGWYNADSTVSAATSAAGLPTSAIRSQRAGTTAIINDTTAVGMADSSIVIDVSGYRSLGLLIKATVPDSAAVPFVRLAIQVRYHLNAASDSSSVFPLFLRETFTASATVDSNMTYGSATAPTAVAADPTEIVVVLTASSAVASKWVVGPSACIPLITRTGAYAFIKDVSIRIRVLSVSGTNVPDATDTDGGKARIKAYLVGSD